MNEWMNEIYNSSLLLLRFYYYYARGAGYLFSTLTATLDRFLWACVMLLLVCIARGFDRAFVQICKRAGACIGGMFPLNRSRWYDDDDVNEQNNDADSTQVIRVAERGGR